MHPIKTGMHPLNLDFPSREARGHRRKRRDLARDLILCPASGSRTRKTQKTWRPLFSVLSSEAFQLNPLPPSPQSSSTPSNHAAESLFLKLASLPLVKKKKLLKTHLPNLTHFIDSGKQT